jgi:hypothetical protein
MIDTDRLLNPEAAILSLEQGRYQKIGDEINHRSGESRNRKTLTDSTGKMSLQSWFMICCRHVSVSLIACSALVKVLFEWRSTIVQVTFTTFPSLIHIPLI